MEAAQDRQMAQANKNRQPNDIAQDDMVWLSTGDLSTNRPSKKLDYKRVGPFKVLT